MVRCSPAGYSVKRISRTAGELLRRCTSKRHLEGTTGIEVGMNELKALGCFAVVGISFGLLVSAVKHDTPFFFICLHAFNISMWMWIAQNRTGNH